MADARTPIWSKVWLVLCLLALAAWLAYAFDW